MTISELPRLLPRRPDAHKGDAGRGRSSDVEAHTQTEALLVHHAALGAAGLTARASGRERT